MDVSPDPSFENIEFGSTKESAVQLLDNYFGEEWRDPDVHMVIFQSIYILLLSGWSDFSDFRKSFAKIFIFEDEIKYSGKNFSNGNKIPQESMSFIGYINIGYNIIKYIFISARLYQEQPI